MTSRIKFTAHSLALIFLLTLAQPTQAGWGSWLRGGDSDWSSTRSISNVQRLARSAQSGNVEAMRKLGIMSAKGEKVRKSYKIAIQWWKKAASHGDTLSMIYLGDLYRSGTGVKEDHAKAMEYYAQAFEQLRKTHRDIKCENDIPVIQRIKKLSFSDTVEWWEEQCENGDEEAMYYLATLKSSVRKNVLSKKKSNEYMIMAAEHGHAKARRTVEKAEPVEYIDYWRKKAEDGSLDNRLKYAHGLYNNGECSREEEEKAAEYFGLAAKEGSSEAKTWLSLFRKRQMLECHKMLAEGKTGEARHLLAKISESEDFNSAAILTEFLNTPELNAEHLKVVLDLPGLTYAEREVEAPFILLAILNNQSAETIKLLIDNHFNVNASHKQTGETPLIAAAKKDNEEIVTLLLESPEINVTAKDARGKDALAYASVHKIRENIQSRIPGKNEPVVSQTSIPAEVPEVPEVEPQGNNFMPDFDFILSKSNDERALFMAMACIIDRNELDLLTRVLKAGISANTSNPGKKKMIVEAHKNHEKALAFADLICNETQNLSENQLADYVLCDTSILIAAVNLNNEAAVRILIENGADVNRSNNYGCTPLFAACINKQSNIVKMLLEAGAQPSLQTKYYLQRYLDDVKILHSRNKEIITELVEHHNPICNLSGKAITIQEDAANNCFTEEISKELAPYLEKLPKQPKTEDNKQQASINQNYLYIGGGVLLLLVLIGVFSISRKKSHKKAKSTIETTSPAPEANDGADMPPPFPASPTPVTGAVPPPLPQSDSAAPMPPAPPSGGDDLPPPPPWANTPKP